MTGIAAREYWKGMKGKQVMNKKQIIKVVCFCLIFCMVFRVCTSVLRPKWIIGTSSTYITEGIYAEPKNSLDVCFIGSSQLIYGVSCMRLLEKYGINAYSCATGEQPLMCSYYYLKELGKYQNYKTVLLDMSMLYEPEIEARYRSTIDSMPFSMNKLKLIVDHCKSSEEAESFFSYVFPILKYHDRWNEIKYRDFRYNELNKSVYKGNNSTAETDRTLTNEVYMVDNQKVDPSIVMVENQRLWFGKVVSYCRENDLELILIKTPKKTWNRSKYEGVKALAEEYDLPYYDFNTKALMDDMQFVASEDMWNGDHFNVIGEDKFTDYLAEHFLTAYMSDSKAACQAYDPKKLADYRLGHENKVLQATFDAKKVLELLSNERFEIVVQKNGSLLGMWNEELENTIKVLGVSVDLTDPDLQNYVGHYRNGQIVYELAGIEPIVYDGQMENGKYVRLESNQEMLPNTIQLSKYVNELTGSGLQFMVYDSQHKEIVDCITITPNEGTGKLEVTHDTNVSKAEIEE